MPRKTIAERIAAKLHPTKVRMPSRAAAILACLLGQNWTRPAIGYLMVTTDGWLLGQNEGDVGMNSFLGPASELDTLLDQAATAGKLTTREKDHLKTLMPAH